MHLLVKNGYGGPSITSNNLLYIDNKTNEVIAEVDLSSKSYLVINFLKYIAKFISSKKAVTKEVNDLAYYQFATIIEGDLFPICWFTIVINDKLKLDFDTAFNTSLVKRNGVNIPFGKFFTKYGKYRHIKMKHKAYKFVANQIK